MCRGTRPSTHQQGRGRAGGAPHDGETRPAVRRGARRAVHGRPLGPRARAPRSARRPCPVQRRASAPCPPAPLLRRARPPTRAIIACMMGVSRNTRAAHPARPRPPQRRGDTDRPLERRQGGRGRAGADAPGPLTIVGRGAGQGLWVVLAHRCINHRYEIGDRDNLRTETMPPQT